MLMECKEIIRLEGVTKCFPGVVALNGVSFSIERGIVHALMGENGAGKSTLIKVLSGTYTDYEGEIFLNGEKIRFMNENDAILHGISVVPQELHPINELSIAENIFLGREPMGKLPGFIDKKRRRTMTLDLLEEFSLHFDPDSLMGDLSVAQKQMIEIIKAISRECKLIIMDEPTSALTNADTRYLFDQIRKLKAKGYTIISISHKIDEVYEICDHVSVLRDGKYIGSGNLQEITPNALVAMMVGREVTDIYPPIEPCTSEEVLRVEHLSSDGIFQDISFRVHRGEILGFSGMMGAGRSEIARSIFGLDTCSSGSFFLDGKQVKITCPNDAIKLGIAMVTEDRATYGFVGLQSIQENIALANMDQYSKNGWLQKAKLLQAVESICRKLRVKASGSDTLVGNLSGGNQQKVVLAKWLVRNIKFLILDEPTRGIDVGAKQEIYKLICSLAAEGMAILLISSEMSEVLSMSHRVMVIADGKAVGEVSGATATANNVMTLIAGGEKK